VVLCFLKGHAKQLVLSLSCLDLDAHIIGHQPQVLALVLQVLDVLVILLLQVHQIFELVLVPLQLLLEADDPGVLGQLRILLLRFRLQELQLLFNFVHVCLEGEPEVVLVLA